MRTLALLFILTSASLSALPDSSFLAEDKQFTEYCQSQLTENDTPPEPSVLNRSINESHPLLLWSVDSSDADGYTQEELAHFLEAHPSQQLLVDEESPPVRELAGNRPLLDYCQHALTGNLEPEEWQFPSDHSVEVYPGLDEPHPPVTLWSFAQQMPLAKPECDTSWRQLPDGYRFDGDYSHEEQNSPAVIEVAAEEVAEAILCDFCDQYGTTLLQHTQQCEKELLAEHRERLSGIYALPPLEPSPEIALAPEPVQVLFDQSDAEELASSEPSTLNTPAGGSASGIEEPVGGAFYCSGEDDDEWVYEGEDTRDAIYCPDDPWDEGDDAMLSAPEGIVEFLPIDEILAYHCCKMKREARLIWRGSIGMYERPLAHLTMHYDHYHALNVYQGRRVLVWAVESLLNDLNQGDGWVHPDLAHGPFEPEDLTIEIHFDTFFGQYVDLTYLEYITMEDGIISYQAYDCRGPRACHTRRERYKDAVFHVLCDLEHECLCHNAGCARTYGYGVARSMPWEDRHMHSLMQSRVAKEMPSAFETVPEDEYCGHEAHCPIAHRNEIDRTAHQRQLHGQQNQPPLFLPSNSGFGRN